MKTTIVMLHYGEKSTTHKALESLKEEINKEILILVNNTNQDVSDLQSIIKNTQLIDNQKNLGFSKGVNQGINLALAQKDIDSVLLLNNDLEISFGSINLLRKTLFKDEKTGIVAPVLHHSDNLYDWGGKYNKWIGNVKHLNFEQKPKKPMKVEHVAGAAMLIKKTLIEKIGLFDERFFLYFEDLDFCIRTYKNDYEIFINPEVVAEHQLSKSSTTLKRTLHQWSSHAKFLLKHLSKLNVYPTAILYNIIFYPFSLFKLLIKKVFNQ